MKLSYRYVLPFVLLMPLACGDDVDAGFDPPATSEDDEANDAGTGDEATDGDSSDEETTHSDSSDEETTAEGASDSDSASEDEDGPAALDAGVDAGDELTAPSDEGSASDGTSEGDTSDTGSSEENAGDGGEESVTDLPTDVSSEGTESIEASGGSVTAGPLELTIPEGALSETTEISWQVVPESDYPEGASIVSQVIDLGPDGLQLDEPVQLRFQFDAEAVPDGASVTIAWYDEGAEEWMPLADSAADGEIAEATTTHFTLFAVIVQSVTVSAEVTESCEQQCTIQATFECPNDLVGDACVADCVEGAAQVAGCETEFAAYGGCVNSDYEANYECDESGEAAPKDGVCQDELLVFATCFQGASEYADECAAYCEDDPLTPPITCDVVDEDAVPCELGCQAVFDELGTECGQKWMATMVCAHGEESHWECTDTGAEFNFDEGVCVDEQTALTECQ